jgi:hypothetical protein
MNETGTLREVCVQLVAISEKLQSSATSLSSIAAIVSAMLGFLFVAQLALYWEIVRIRRNLDKIARHDHIKVLD